MRPPVAQNVPNYVALPRSKIQVKPHPVSAKGIQSRPKQANSAENLSRNADSDDFYAASYSIAPSVVPGNNDEFQDNFMSINIQQAAGTPEGRRGGMTP